jgi:hypothetical protein
MLLDYLPESLAPGDFMAAGSTMGLLFALAGYVTLSHYSAVPGFTLAAFAQMVMTNG